MGGTIYPQLQRSTEQGQEYYPHRGNQPACQPHSRTRPTGCEMAQDEGNQRGRYQLQEDHLREMDSCAKRSEQHRETRGNQVNK